MWSWRGCLQGLSSQSFECFVFFKDMREDRHGVGRGKAARATAGQQLVFVRMRRAVRAEEKACIAGCGGSPFQGYVSPKSGAVI